MPRNDKRVAKQTEKLIYQQAGSRCSFCSERAISLLEIHHIISRAEGGSNDPANLILVCRNCHGRIESGEITRDEVLRTKRDLGATIHQLPSQDHASQVNNLSVAGSVNSSILANNLIIGRNTRLTSRLAHPAGSIGANLMKKNYIDYLITRYYDFKKADASYGVQQKRTFSHAVIHASIARKFKAKTFFIPEGRFEELAKYLQGRVDQTIQGRRNRKQGRQSYCSFEQYFIKYGK